MAFSNAENANTASAVSGVGFIRKDLAERFKSYDLVAACLGGSEAVKAERDRYLPIPDAANTSADNVKRYDNYLQRAVFYNVTQRTALGLQGQIFLRPPVVEAPALLENVVTDSNGSGIGLEQLARDATWYAVGFGRAGLFIDYPPTVGVTSRADQAAGNIRPTITVFGPKNVINWRMKTVGSKQILCLVVLKEEYTAEDDGFETATGTQYRELRLSADNIYSVQLWRPTDINGSDYVKFGSPYFPTDGTGKALDAIPFTFIGSRNNEPSIDPVPLLDMANINIAHYCNSADYEEMVYIVGQPMLVVSGLTSEWYKDVMKEKIPFGSRSGMALPVGGEASLLQVAENSAAKEAMEHKERQMVALGAKVVEQKQVQRTAKEAGMENAAEESVLGAIAKNVSVAMQWALEWCALFMNTPETGVKFELNTDFELSRMDATEAAAVVKLWQDGATSFTEMRDSLRKAGKATQDDEIARAEIDADATAAIAQAAAEIGAATAAANANTPDDAPTGGNVGNE